MGERLDFESTQNKIKNYKPDYELIELIRDKDNRTRLKLKYLPTGESFDCTAFRFFRDRAHAPSISKKVRSKKAKAIFLEKYGVDNPLKVQEFQDKQKATMIERYGCERPAQNEQIKDKIKSTNLKNTK